MVNRGYVVAIQIPILRVFYMWEAGVNRATRNK